MRRTTSGRRAGQRFDAEYGVVTEALIFLGELDPEAIGPNIAFATHYEATPPADVDLLLDAAGIDERTTTFVDLGSGMARAVLIAARRPFRQVAGVEISPALHAVALENLAAIDRASLRCKDVRLVCNDAADYRFPPGDLAIYLYNPFSAGLLVPLLERVVELALGLDRLQDRGPPLVQLPQVTQPFLERPQLGVIQRPGHFLAVAGDERHRGPAVEQLHGRRDLALPDGERGDFALVADLGFGAVYRLARGQAAPGSGSEPGR